MSRSEMRKCGKRFGSAGEAERYKARKPGAKPELCRDPKCGGWHLRTGQVTPKPQAKPRKPLAPVSAKRRVENRERRAVVAELWPDGRPQCERPGCTRLADDVHERLSRGRGGSITDPDNLAALCREHHDEVTFTPESELGWAYDCDLLRHSWPGKQVAA